MIIRVVHVPFGFPPDPVGGTEVYVESLARELQARGVEAIVAAPGEEAAYALEGPVSYTHLTLPTKRIV